MDWQKDFWPLIDRMTRIAHQGRSKLEFIDQTAEAVFPYCHADLLRFCFPWGDRLRIVKTYDPDPGRTGQDCPACVFGQKPESCAFRKSLFPVDSQNNDLFQNRETVPYLVWSAPGRISTNMNVTWPGSGPVDPALFSGQGGPGDGYHSLTLLPIPYGREEPRLLLFQALVGKPGPPGDRTLENLLDIGLLLHLSLAVWTHGRSLNRRITELDCLNRISHLIDKPETSLADVFQKVAGFIPSAWLYPEAAVSRIVFDGHQYAGAGYPYGKQRLRADIRIEGQKRGFVEVCYTQDKPVLEEGPFLREERNLLEVIARELSRIAENRIQLEQMAAIKEQLQHANRLTMTGQVAAAVAHELNEPLTNIMGFAQLAAKAEDLSPEVKKDLDKIVGLSLHTREIVRRLLMFSKKMPKSTRRMDLNAVTREALSFLEHHCLKKGLSLDFTPFYEPLTLSADPNQIKQVVFNLVLNAVHASDPGGSIGVETTRSGSLALLKVSDQGHGMTPDVLEKIFIPFFSTKQSGEGTGLGLSVVKEIVEAHQGEIKVISAPAQGSRVTVGFDLNLP